ncbi:DNA polymerase-3 subunit alpha [Actinopolymorpha cephalotaxi]|uniref:DNA polymerase III subunit alpha n=1 Tax=Actinopolymorpha cephalotaxi TaxID=504797 RepID=A0A1I2M4L3_9ACTN|nr:DNA polymerase III subunit alpha [Actinopolymorpha cephalotaxi]NYH81559.1 DNA polymerase-3 subunit alpha [Actinopolymorpha cephalotaxi]SFF85820.1 DNA polymerase-3 subunit alpha [Actinopolymorpha cephalotaxi]
MPASGNGDFVHLHVHSEYSMLDGAARVGDLFAACEEQRMPAVALTDHGYLFGAYEFYKAAQRTAVKPIVGLEAYLTPKTHRGDRTRVRWGDGGGAGGDDVSGGGAYTHLTLLAENNLGMHNLFRLGSRAAIEGFFYKPRMDRELLHAHADGLIATTGCPSGEVQTYLRLGQYDQARASAAEFRDIFGAGNYYVELMDHGLQIERRVRTDLLRLAKDLALPLVATNDLHYVRREDATAHEVLLCVQSASTLADPKRFRLDGDGYYLKSAAEMRDLFRDLPQACDATLDIAERCEISFSEGEGRYMPRYPCPPAEDETSWFLKEVDAGLRRRYPAGIPGDVRARADFEAEVIIGKGYPGYFLVVADFITWATDRGIRSVVRGSGAGSMCAYAMRITDLDPLEHGLIFERFLNPERKSMPDFDVDFDERRRGEVIRYVTEKYGDDRVCQIVTYGTIKAKQAVKDASRVLGHPFATGDRITKAMPAPVMGKDVGLKQLFDTSHSRYGEGGEFRALCESDAEVATVVEKATGIEGLKRQWGMHAAGVIMSSEPLIDIVPLMKREQNGAILTQFDYPACESLGLVKMDFLGLRNLAVLGDAIANVQLARDVDVDLESLGKSRDDKETYALLARGDTLGVFQLDGGPMRALLKLMKPDRFEDIAATIALYRPGPMGANSHINYAQRKNGQQETSYLHPELAEALEPILGETYGLIIYQEQVLEIARQLAGYSLGSADLLRKAMGKKKKEVLDAEFVNFEAGMVSRGFSAQAVTALWDVLVPFSDYAFNKAHSAAYGLVAYWAAYLKAHYPAEYMAAVLTSVGDVKDRLALYLGECRHMGITVLPPDVNESDATFTPVGEDVRFGLTAVRNVGANVVEAIVAARGEKGRFADFTDFLAKVPLPVCNKRVVESLVKAGAFDSLGHRRRALTACHEDAIDHFVREKRAEAVGQHSLFGSFDADGGDRGAELGMPFAIPDVEEWDKRVLLANERNMLGLYVSDHPLNGLEHELAKLCDTTVAPLLADDERPDGATVTIAGLVTAIQRKITRRGDAWAVVRVEDLTAGIDVLLFPSTYQLVGANLAEDSLAVVTGRLDRREDTPQLIATDLSQPDPSALASSAEPLAITLTRERCTQPVVDRLKEIFAAHHGSVRVHLHLRAVDRTLVLRLEDHWQVTPGPALVGDLKALLGPGCLRP